MTNFRIAFFSLTLVAAATLVACGGGGGGSDSSSGGTSGGSGGGTSTTPPTEVSQPTAAAPALVAVDTTGNLDLTRTTATYASGSMAADAFTALDNARIAAGTGVVAQSTLLDTAVTAHAAYWTALSTSTTLTTAQATEFATLGAYDEATDLEGTLYYGDTPEARAVKAGAIVAGYFSTETLGTASGATVSGVVAASGAACISGLLDSVYHADALLSPISLVGIAPATSSTGAPMCFIDYAQPTPDGAVPGSGSTIVNPAPGSTVSGTYAIASEVPRPASAQITTATAGTPVLYNARSADWINDSLAGTLAPVVTSFSLSTADGTPVSAVVLVSSAFTGPGTYTDANLLPGTLVLIPTQPLAAGTYSAHVSVSLSAHTVQTKDWSFIAQ